MSQAVLSVSQPVKKFGANMVVDDLSLFNRTGNLRAHWMWERLQSVLQQGQSILLTTDLMDEVEHLCERLLVRTRRRFFGSGRNPHARPRSVHLRFASN